MSKVAYAAVASAALLVGCQAITEELPTQPTKVRSATILTIPIPAIPGATPTPKPTPTPGPNPTPTPDPSPTPTPDPSGCGNPLPPGISKIDVKVHIHGPNMDTLDSTPKVCDGSYCKKVGYTDGRTCCPVRPEGAPDRIACEAYAVGEAEDTGRPGPTWTHNGDYCDGTYCNNTPENQYQLFVYKSGTYTACTSNGVCGQVTSTR